MAILLSKNSSMARSIGFQSLKNSSLARSIGVQPSKNSSMARSVGFQPSKNSPLARSVGFQPLKNSSLARSVGFQPSKNSSLASSSLIVCPSRPMDIIGGNYYSLPMTYYSTSAVPTTTTSPTTESCRRPTSMQLPWLILAPENTVNRFYSLWEKDVKEFVVESSGPPPHTDSRCLGQSVQGWMGYIRRKDCQVFLYNPLSGKKINLLSVETIPSVKSVIRNSQSGLVERVVSDLGSSKPLTPRSCYRGLITDVVLSSSPMDDDCIAVVIYGAEDKLAFCRRSKRPNCWIPLDSPFVQHDQIVYHSGKKLFYTLTARGWEIELEAWDLHSDPIKRFHIEDQSQILREMHDWPPCFLKHRDLSDSLDEVDSPHCYKRIHLVYDHQSQELFIVMRHILRNVSYTDGVPHISGPDLITDKTMTFDVFKVDFINDHLVKVQNLEDSIGNRAFFVGKRRGFVLSTTEFPELRSGSIYFAYDYAPHDMGIYDYKENGIIGKIESISPANSWFIPDVDADF